MFRFVSFSFSFRFVLFRFVSFRFVFVSFHFHSFSCHFFLPSFPYHSDGVLVLGPLCNCFPLAPKKCRVLSDRLLHSQVMPCERGYHNRRKQCLPLLVAVDDFVGVEVGSDIGVVVGGGIVDVDGVGVGIVVDDEVDIDVDERGCWGFHYEFSLVLHFQQEL
jgi:hypothetical protein